LNNSGPWQGGGEEQRGCGGSCVCDGGNNPGKSSSSYNSGKSADDGCARSSDRSHNSRESQYSRHRWESLNDSGPWQGGCGGSSVCDGGQNGSTKTSCNRSGNACTICDSNAANDSCPGLRNRSGDHSGCLGDDSCGANYSNITSESSGGQRHLGCGACESLSYGAEGCRPCGKSGSRSFGNSSRHRVACSDKHACGESPANGCRFFYRCRDKRSRDLCDVYRDFGSGRGSIRRCTSGIASCGGGIGCALSGRRSSRCRFRECSCKRGDYCCPRKEDSCTILGDG